jgi:hypothetical protein
MVRVIAAMVRERSGASTCRSAGDRAVRAPKAHDDRPRGALRQLKPDLLARTPARA